MTEKLSAETIAAEKLLNSNLKLIGPLAVRRQIRKELPKMKNYQAEKHIRLMRFDFHPTVECGWAVSEVNSDVPGGFAESAIMPELAADLFEKGRYERKNLIEILTNEIAKKTKPGGRIMFVHCTSYSDDRQMMQSLGDRLQSMNFKIIYAAADHLVFKNNKAVSVLGGSTGEVDAVFRFTPVEWFVGIKPKKWQGYFNTETPSCNHPVAVLSQTKRFPLIWEELEKLGANFSAWRELMPETLTVRQAKNKEGFIYKPACGRVGESIAIKEACAEEEYKKILQDVKRHPKRYVAQKRFNSLPLKTDEGEIFHVCLGVYSVEGRAAGFYARTSKLPRIDSTALNTPVLIERRKK